MTASVGTILPQLSQGRRRISQFFAVQALRDSRRELRRTADKVSCTGNVGAGTEFFLAVQALRDSRRELRRTADKVSCTGNVGAGTEFFPSGA
jgi:hypothetical protein